MSVLLKAIHTAIFLIVAEQCLAEPSFRIIAPQTICKHAGNGSLTSDPQAIVVGFQPRDGIKLSYKVKIFFKITGNRTRSQRNTLLVWKAVRSLENRVNVKERLKISQQNMVSINKTEVEPGVVYMFHIIGVTDAGEMSKEQIFTIKYTDGVLERNETAAAGLNLLLIGAENTVASIPYTITARVSFCVPRYDYYLRWKMLGLDEEFQDILHITGAVLKIPPNSLAAGKEYQIQASVLQSDDSMLLAQDFITVQVVKKGFQAYIIPTSVKIGLNKPAIFEVFVQDFDNNCDRLEIFWECTSNDGEKCSSNESTNSTKFEFFFSIPGRYDISATLKLGEITRFVKGEVIVDPTVYLSYEFSNIPNLVQPAGQALLFSVLIVDLIPNCKAGWSSAQEDGFVYIRPEEIGDGFGTVEVKDLEREYLSEIADFGNSTVNKEIILSIPAASDKWSGFQGDSNYKFRLDTVCPGPYIPNDPESIQRKVVSSLEFVVNTNSPPVGGNLHVKPRNGTALRTFFEISSESAKDLLLDTPLSYEFLIQVEHFNISLGKFYEFKSIDTQLPYSESPIQVISRVCDIRSACNMNNGPKIRVDSTEYTQKDILSMENRISESFRRTDFDQGQNLILIAALTYKNTPNSAEVFENFKTFSTDLLFKEIDKQYESPTEKYYISKEDIVSFISQTKINLDLLNVNDPIVLGKLLDLLDLTAEDNNNNDDTSTNIENFRRRKRDVDADTVLSGLEGRSIIDAAYVRMNLNLIEKILESYKDENMKEEKAKVVQRIPVLAMKMCTSDLITKENIFTTVAAINIEKMTGNHLIEKNFTIVNYFTPASGNFRITLPALKSRVKYYCAAFIQFPEDYFDGEKQISYRLQLLDLSTLISVKEIENRSEDFVAEFKMPKLEQSQDICLMRSSEQWSPDFCSTKLITKSHVVCHCRNFGFLKVGTQNKYVVPTPGKRPPTLVIPPPNKNIVSSTNKTPSSEVTTTFKPKPVQATTPKTTVKTTQAPSITTALPLSSAKTKDGDNKHLPEATSKASALSYTLPFFGLLSILLIIGAAVFYKRRKRNALGNNLQGLDIMTTVPRQSRPGIKYAKFYDEHLMTGNFNNTSPS